MNKSELTQQNIQNLTGLWKEIALHYSSFRETPLYNSAVISNYQWPNRLWLNEQINEENISFLKNTVLNEHPNLVIPYWEIYDNESSIIFDKNGFEILFQQLGMSLKPKSHFITNNSITIQQVKDTHKAELWSKLFCKAFGYSINPTIVSETKENVHYYIAYADGKEVGTAITYKSENTIGMHAVGIIPEARKKGHAEQLMRHLINKAIDDKISNITLQASDMGKGLYLKLGFEIDFLMKNYTLRKKQ